MLIIFRFIYILPLLVCYRFKAICVPQGLNRLFGYNCSNGKKISPPFRYKFHERNIKTFFIRHSSNQCIEMIVNITWNFLLFQGQDFQTLKLVTL